MVDAPVVRVELFEDRASVLRKVALPSEIGRHTLEIGPLCHLVSERHLSFPADSGIEVESFVTRRRRVPQKAADTALAAGLEARVKAKADEVRALIDEAKRLRDSAARAEATVAVLQDRLTHALMAGGKSEDWEAHLREAEGRIIARTLEASDRDRDRERKEREVDALQLELEAARTPTEVERVFVTLRVHVREAGALHLRYTVPCAVWRPRHRVVLEGNQVTWEVGAIAWNATGEDWNDVEVVCSTARPGEPASLPKLQDDVVRTTAREAEIVVEARDETVHVAREGGEQADESLGVDDGGEPRTFTAPKRMSLPSTGMPLVVPLDTWTAEATVERRCHPERSPRVCLVTRQKNAGTRPLLAGPVHLFRMASGGGDSRGTSGSGTGSRGALAVGESEVGFVGPGEPFWLGWGSEDGIRVTRRLDRTVERARLTGHQTWKTKVTLAVAHVGIEPLTVRIRERIPVSEIREVTLPEPHAEPPCTEGPDQDGFCDWILTQEPGSHREIVLDYTVEAPSRVVLPF